jgi:mannosyltransferase
MTIEIPISLDCIIFGLQQFGGVSNYWAKIVEYVSSDPELSGSLVLPRQMKYRDFDDAWIQRMPVKREVLHPQVSRYLNAHNIYAPNAVFHTPYYRLPQQFVKKYVVTVHDFTYERYIKGLARIVHTKQKVASIRRADAVLCVSESTRRDVIEFCPDIDASKLHVTHLGVDCHTFYQDPVNTSAINDQTVLFVGQRGRYKRFDLAIEAVRESPRLILGVVGNNLTDEERILLRGRLGSRWREFGPISNCDLRRLYSSAFAFIYPSDYEGFGLPILEAMACGCPVVAASLSSLPEVGGAAAHYAERQSSESYAKLLCSLESAELRNESVRRGLKRVAEFDWLLTLQKTKAVYLNQ